MSEPLHRQMQQQSFVDTAYPIAMTAIVDEDVNHMSEGAIVKIYMFDEGVIPHGPCPWQPRVLADGTIDMPSKGDNALVIMDENDDAWIICWWPFDRESQPSFDGDSLIDPAADGTSEDPTPPPDLGDPGGA